MRGALRRAALAAIAAAFVLGPAPVAHAKDYYFPSVFIDIQIRPDGSFDVREDRTYEFDGSFHRAFIEIPLTNNNFTYEISNATVSEKGAFYRRAEPGPEESGTFTFTKGTHWRIDWYYDAADQERTFTITYHVSGAIAAYEDVAEFYWQFIGGEWTVRTDRAVAVVHLPPGASR